MFTVVDRSAGECEGEFGPGLTGEAEETWVLIADGDDYNTEHVRASGILPEPYVSTHRDNGALVFMPPKVRQHAECPRLFIAKLKWTSTPLQPKDKEKDVDDPTERPAKVRIRTESGTEVKFTDAYGRAKLNSAGEYFDPPPENNRFYLAIEVEKNVRGLPDWVFDLIDCVNVADFEVEGRPIFAGRACLVDINLGDVQYEGDWEYRVATFTIHVKKPREPREDESDSDVPGPWQTECLDQGLHEKDSENPNRLIRITDNSDPPQPLAGPVLLDGNGKRLLLPTPDRAKYVVWNDHAYADFSGLPLT